ncbi:MAG: hypothetical protein A2V70_19460 [Planctomycetes bacterium RBG_13_63_9]|nr:MAG: hypothetical protein A2V70_19460 [Planctomycetes bacterium RBG_13_63_9]
MAEFYVPGSLVDQILVGIANYTFAIYDRLNNLVGNTIQGLADYASQIEYALGKTLNNVFNQLGSALNYMATSVTRAFGSMLDGIGKALANMWSRLESVISGVLDRMAALANQAIASVQAFAATIVNTVTGWIASAYDFLRGLATTAINAIGELATKVGTKVLELLGTAFVMTDRALARQIATVESAVQRVFAGTDSLLTGLNTRLTQVKEGFADAATEVVKGITEVSEEFLKPLTDSIRAFADAYVPGDTGATLPQMLAALRGTRTDPGQMEVFRGFWRTGFEDLAKRGPVFQTVFSFLFLLLTILPSMIRIGGVLSETSVQEWNRQYPYALMAPADAAQAVRHSLISEEQALEDIRRQGFSEEKARQLIKLTAFVPPEGDLITMHLRGIIDTPAMDAAFKLRGYDAPWVERLRTAALIVPPVHDLITMAVREAFTPAVAERFGQYEDYPAALTPLAKQIGLSEEWSKRYWAAHWSLPSAEMGFEMLHRRKPGTRESIISPDELRTLLRALDIMPFWRDKLIDLSYSPYTRVDIRRMHQMGLLTREQVYDAHLDLGYDADRAEKLTAFTEKLNKGAPSDDEQELGKLSRTAVLDFFKDGILTREKTVSLLEGLNYTPEAAALYVQSVELDVQRAARKAEADHVIELATTGTLDFGAAQDKLNQLGLTKLEVESALTKLVRAQESKTKLPTRGEGESFFTKGIINEATYKDLLERLGYAPKWVAAYITFAKGKSRAS